MAKKIVSKPGLFGTTVHYDERGKVVGKSSPGMFGSTVHYDANGKIVGKSSPGFLEVRYIMTIITEQMENLRPVFSVVRSTTIPRAGALEKVPLVSLEVHILR